MRISQLQNIRTVVLSVKRYFKAVYIQAIQILEFFAIMVEFQVHQLTYQLLINDSGLDIAFTQNHYLWHTEFDRAELIRPGSLQRAGLSFCLI